MIRTILYVIVAVLAISALRSVIGIFAKAFANFVNPQQQPPPAARRPTVEAGGELKRDPVCGTFISTATALQKKAGGEVYYFCSEACREKFSPKKSEVRSQKSE
jgi:YHS domain-containing protein